MTGFVRSTGDLGAHAISVEGESLRFDPRAIARMLVRLGVVP